MRKKKTTKECPECGAKLIYKRSADARVGNKYECPECAYEYEEMPTG